MWIFLCSSSPYKCGIFLVAQLYYSFHLHTTEPVDSSVISLICLRSIGVFLVVSFSLFFVTTYTRCRERTSMKDPTSMKSEDFLWGNVSLQLLPQRIDPYRYSKHGVREYLSAIVSCWRLPVSLFSARCKGSGVRLLIRMLSVLVGSGSEEYGWFFFNQWD